MSVPQNKIELLSAIEKNYTRLLADLAAVPEDRLTERTLGGHTKGTTMSVHDLVAYLTGWNELVLKWCEGKRSATQVDFLETGYRWNELGRLAQKFYADYEDLSFAELLARFETAKSTIVAIIDATDDKSLYGVPWYESWTMGRMIQFNTSSPYANARSRLRKGLKETAAN